MVKKIEFFEKIEFSIFFKIFETVQVVDQTSQLPSKQGENVKLCDELDEAHLFKELDVATTQRRECLKLIFKIGHLIELNKICDKHTRPGKIV